MKKYATTELTTIALMAAVICILGPLSIPLPFSPVPIAFANLAICLSVYLLGAKKSLISLAIYLVIGLAGLPVFSNFRGGFGVLAGPTGGYLVGYVFLCLIAGYAVDAFPDRRMHIAIGMVLGTVVLYAFGTAWLAYQAKLTFVQALWAGVIPYIPGDLIKIGIALVLGPVIKQRLIRAGFMLGAA